MSGSEHNSAGVSEKRKFPGTPEQPPATAAALSLCLSTYNRCGLLAVTLESLARQDGLRHVRELLIIDNNCTDATASVVADYAGRLPLTLLRESRQGLSHCRNRGIAEFSGDLLLFLDDDVVLEPDWLSGYAAAVAAFPDADIFGGRIKPRYQDGKPRWLKDDRLALLAGILVHLDLGEDVRLMASNEAGPFGASFGIRRRLFDKVGGGFRADLGRVGMTPGRGEETEFFDRAAGVGAARVYVGNALCWHHTDPARLSLPAIYRHGLAKGQAHAVVHGTADAGSWSSLASCAVRGVMQIPKGRGDRARQSLINFAMAMELRRLRALEK